MDAKSLLRAQKAGARVQHPHATYSAAGQLRCTVCAVPVKQWDAHLLTKQHRASAQREKAEEAKRAAAAAKRKQAEAPDAQPESAKRQRMDEPEDGPSLPAGFFSSGNKPSVADEDEDGESSPKPAESEGKKEEDPELDAFLASLDDEPEAPAPTAVEQKEEKGKKRRTAGYKEAEAGVASYAAAPVLIQRTEGGEREPTPEPEETEAERRERLAREEKEEIFARLEDEQRAQEDADNRVLALKARMEALKKRREAKKPKPKTA